MEKCCGEVLWRGVVVECCSKVLWRSVVVKCCREILGKNVLESDVEKRWGREL